MATSLLYHYRAWDGTQAVELLDAEQVLLALANDLLDGNIAQALDRAMHRGLNADSDGASTGIDTLRDQIRSKRAATEDAIAGSDDLHALAEGLASAAGSGDALDGDTASLLAALAARPDAARVLSHLPSQQREQIAGALQSFVPSRLEGADWRANESSDFSAWLDEIVQRLETMEELEQQLRRIRRVQDVDDIDLQLVEAVLGRESATQFARLAGSLQQFVGSGYIRVTGNRQHLSARALQHIGDELLAAALERVAMRGGGDRHLPQVGQHDLTGSTRDYQFGDPLSLDLSRTVMQAIRRGSGVPVRLAVDDFAIFERETSARAATVLAIDLSRSMGERGYLLSAKQLALALLTLIRTRFPRDEFRIIGFSDAARLLAPHELPHLTWDRFGFGTNVQDALRLARSILAAHRGMQRNIILLTDGEPTAHRDNDGKVHFHHPTAPDTLAFTYAEVDRVRRDGISLGVCVLSSEMQVVKFAEYVARAGAGDLIVTSPDDLSAAMVTRYGATRKR